ncbi:MAG: S1C family serine protease [Candidatus Promineifilaceae bacterium]
MLKSFKPYYLIVLSLIVVLLAACGQIGADDVALQPVVQTSSPEPLLQQLSHLTGQTAQTAQATVTAPAAAAAPATAVTGLGEYFAHEQAFINVFEQTSPSVVQIGLELGEGSGFIYDDNGHIVTNNHVVSGANRIMVTFSDGSQREATVVGTAPDADLAVIQVDAQPGELTPLPLGDSNALRVGQIVVAIGSPFGFENTLTTGVVSGLDRLFPGAQSPDGGTYNIPNVIQTDAAINPGNSGGPLLDLKGNVVGINTAIESPVQGSSGVGFAVPSNVVKVVVPQLIANGRVQTPWLGISGTELTNDLAESLGLAPETRGIAIAEVVAGSPAAAAGLQAATVNSANGNGQQLSSAGDVIVAIDGQPVKAFDDLLGYIVENTAVGQTVELQVLRNGQVETVSLTLQARPSNS